MAITTRRRLWRNDEQDDANLSPIIPSYEEQDDESETTVSDEKYTIRQAAVRLRCNGLSVKLTLLFVLLSQVDVTTIAIFHYMMIDLLA